MYTITITISNPKEGYTNPDELYTIADINFKYTEQGRIKKLRGIAQSDSPIHKDVQERMRVYFKDFGEKVELAYKVDPAIAKAARQSRKAHKVNNVMNGTRSAKKSVKRGAKSVALLRRRLSMARRASNSRQKIYSKKRLSIRKSGRKSARKSAKKGVKSTILLDTGMNYIPNSDMAAAFAMGAPSVQVRRKPSFYRNMSRRSRNSRQKIYSKKRRIPQVGLSPIIEKNENNEKNKNNENNEL